MHTSYDEDQYMRCEVCGEEIQGEPQRRVIEGAKMVVCGRCASFGSGDWSPSRPTRPRRRLRRSTPTVRRKSDVEQAEELEVVEDYGNKIKRARQKAGMKVEDLARKIQEKESLIKKMEKEDFEPTPRLAEKLKRVLNIELMERVETTSGPVITQPRGPRTLGDLIKIKEVEEEE
jgi:putative transcription factor